MNAKTMKHISLLTTAVLLWAGVATVRAADGDASALTAATNSTLAEKLVGQVADIQQGDLVEISGSVADQRLLEDLAVSVRKRGAFPMITISSGRLMRQMFDEVPAQFDSQLPQFDMNLAGFISAIIMVDIPDADQAMAGADASRLAVINKANDAPYLTAQSLNRLEMAMRARCSLICLSSSRSLTHFWRHTGFRVLEQW
jgi:hypothetical protein